MALGLDSDGPNHNSGSGGTSQTLSVTCHAGSLLLMFVQLNIAGSSPLSVTGISGGGLAWAKLGAVTAGTNPAADFELWWAYSSGAQSGATVTISFSGTAAEWVFSCQGFTGAVTSGNPFDADSAITPYSSSGTGTLGTVVVSTVNATTWIITAIASGSSSANSASTGTQIDAANTGSGAYYAAVATQYNSETSPQSGLSCKLNSGVSAPYLMLGAALVPAATPNTIHSADCSVGF